MDNTVEFTVVKAVQNNPKRYGLYSGTAWYNGFGKLPAGENSRVNIRYTVRETERGDFFNIKEGSLKKSDGTWAPFNEAPRAAPPQTLGEAAMLPALGAINMQYKLQQEQLDRIGEALAQVLVTLQKLGADAGDVKAKLDALLKDRLSDRLDELKKAVMKA